MRTKRDLRIPAEVTTLIGTDQAENLMRGPYPRQYRCRYCRGQGDVDAGPPTTLGVDIYEDGTRRVWVAHVRCGLGGVVHQQGPLPDLSAVGWDATGVLAVIDGWAVAIVEIVMAQVALASVGNEVIDLTLATLSRLGMQPVSVVGGQPPASVRSWRVVRATVDDPDGGIFDPHGNALLTPIPVRPAGWEGAVAAHRGLCGLYVVTRFGLAGWSTHSAPQAFFAALAVAAHTGRVAGTTATVEGR